VADPRYPRAKRPKKQTKKLASGMTRIGRFFVETWRGLHGSGHLWAVRNAGGQTLAHGECNRELDVPDAVQSAIDGIA